MPDDSLVDEFRTRLGELGFELADLRIGGAPRRPLVQVRIDWPPATPTRRVTVEDCARASRALETWLDSDAPLGTRYVLEVSSPGVERPLRWPEHWARFIGRDVRVRVPGLGRVRATIMAVPDATRVVLRPEGAEPREVLLADLTEATLAIDW